MRLFVKVGNYSIGQLVNTVCTFGNYHSREYVIKSIENLLRSPSCNYIFFGGPIENDRSITLDQKHPEEWEGIGSIDNYKEVSVLIDKCKVGGKVL